MRNILIFNQQKLEIKSLHIAEILKTNKSKGTIECQLVDTDSYIPITIQTKNKLWIGTDDEGKNYELLTPCFFNYLGGYPKIKDIASVTFMDGRIYYCYVNDDNFDILSLIFYNYPYPKISIDKSKKIIKSNWYQYFSGTIISIERYINSPLKGIENFKIFPPNNIQ